MKPIAPVFFLGVFVGSIIGAAFSPLSGSLRSHSASAAITTKASQNIFPFPETLICPLCHEQARIKEIWSYCLYYRGSSHEISIDRDTKEMRGCKELPASEKRKATPEAQ